MQTVLLVVHLMVVLALVGVVLLQRSEGGALGIGGGGGGFMTSRGTANVLTRATAILAAVFFATSIMLTVIPRYFGGTSVLDRVPVGETTVPATPGEGGGILDQIRPAQPAAPVPQPGAQLPSAPTVDPLTPAAETPAAPEPFEAPAMDALTPSTLQPAETPEPAPAPAAETPAAAPAASTPTP
jgi:preprotein translocase subunit SecG